MRSMSGLMSSTIDARAWAGSVIRRTSAIESMLVLTRSTDRLWASQSNGRGYLQHLRLPSKTIKNILKSFSRFYNSILISQNGTTTLTYIPAWHQHHRRWIPRWISSSDMAEVVPPLLPRVHRRPRQAGPRPALHNSRNGMFKILHPGRIRELRFQINEIFQATRDLKITTQRKWGWITKRVLRWKRKLERSR